MAVRFDAAGDYLLRTANLPSSTAFTICGWAVLSVDRNAYSSLASIESGTASAGQTTNLNTDTDGTSVKLFSPDTPSLSSTIISLTVGTPFFWAMTANGNGAGSLQGYARTSASNTLSSASGTATSHTSAALFVGNNSYSEFWNGRIWNVKVWDRALSATELLIESFYERPQFPTSLNLWLPLPNANDTADRSGNGRNPTVGGTLTTEDSTVNLWRPSAKLLIPVAAPSGGLVVNPLSGIGGAAAQPLVG